MTELAPFRLDPVLVERPWGGTRLTDYGKTLPAGVNIGESWELCDLPQEVVPHVDDPSSGVLDGPYAGARLRTVVAERARGICSARSRRRRTAAFRCCSSCSTRASICRSRSTRTRPTWPQHPGGPPQDRVLVHRRCRSRRRALPRRDVAGTTIDDVGAVMGTPGIVPLLGERAGRARARSTTCRPGLIHALGAGTFVAEVQTPSDTTFRIYDWAVEYGRAPRPAPRRASRWAASSSSPGGRLLTRYHRRTRACANW